MLCSQVVVGRTGDQTLTSEAGDVTRCACSQEHGLQGSQAWQNMCVSPLSYCCVDGARWLCCSHLQGMFFRTARMLEAGIKPVYVFDGTPPNAKKEELARR